MKLHEINVITLKVTKRQVNIHVAPPYCERHDRGSLAFILLSVKYKNRTIFNVQDVREMKIADSDSKSFLNSLQTENVHISNHDPASSL